MAGNEDVEALENVLVRATSLLDTLNDAIERAVRQENLLYYQGPTKSSPNTILDQVSHTASSDSPADYNYMLGGEAYSMPQQAQEYPPARSLNPEFEIVQGEAKLLSEIREILSTIEETLFKVLELQDHQTEERAEALREVERNRELLLTVVKGHRGMETEVVKDILLFCSGEVPEGPLEEEEDDEEGVEEAEADEEEEDEEEDGEELAIEYYSPQVYRRALVSPFSHSHPTPQQPTYSPRNQPRSLPRNGAEGGETTGEERGGKGGISRRRRSPVIQEKPKDLRGNGQPGKGQGEKKKLLGAILTFPGYFLGALGDAVGHAANFGIKLAVVGLGAAAVISLGQEIATMYRSNRRRQLIESKSQGRIGANVECTIRERMELRQKEGKKQTGQENEPQVFLAVG